jgi:hypothetical protein
VGGLVALVLLVLGEVAPGAAPVQVSLENRQDQVVITTEGSTHTFQPPIDRPWTSVRLVQSDPTEREYQIDGSDVTSRKDRDPDEIRAFEATPLYQIAAWLRDESSYSRWDDARLVDLASGQTVARGVDAVEAARLPPAFLFEASLRRPEAPVQVDFVTDAPEFHGVVEIAGDSKTVIWSVGEKGSQKKGSWFFPEQPAPFAADLMQLLGRSVAAGYLLLVLAFIISRVGGWLVAAVRGPGGAQTRAARGFTATQPVFGTSRLLGAAANRVVLVTTIAVGAIWLLAACWVTVRLYHQLPHVVDAAAYYFEANVLASGRWWFDEPPMVNALKGYFETVHDGHWFAQYPPGAPALYAVGSLVGLAWLVGPLAGLALIVTCTLAARQFFGKSAALATLALSAISPFILFQAGAFLSHAIAGAFLGGALAAFAYAESGGRQRWHAVAGACLGWAFLTRELSTLLFGLPLVIWLLAYRRWSGLALLIAAGVPFAIAYLAYNAQLTGSPLLLPRNVVNANDVIGFGSVGDNQHTLAAGLSYADQNLTLLQFDLFGWAPLFALSVLCLPFVLGRANRYDVLLGGGLLVYLVGYLVVPGAGIVLGPRYYYEALPWILLLAARGLQAIAATLRGWGVSVGAARAGVVGVVVLLSLSTFLFYDPHLVERRTDYFAMDRNRGVTLPFVENTFFGPRLTGFEEPSLVLVPDEVAYKTLSALNCRQLDRQHVQACPVLFFSSGVGGASALAKAYPGRNLYVARLVNGTVVVEPFQPPAG